MEQSAPRVVEADRSQLELRPFDLDSTISPDHRARLVWRAVESLDLSGFDERIKARVDTAGRPPGDPKVFVALWLYATMDGVGAAREVERLCREHRAYRWICGGVPVNYYHTLSDFRVVHGATLDDLLTQTIAVLMERKLVEVKRVAQDGLRVRASAGAGSFRRKKKLRHDLKEARAQVEAVKQLAADAARNAMPANRPRGNGQRGSASSASKVPWRRSKQSSASAQSSTPVAGARRRASRAARPPTPRRARCAWPTAASAPATTCSWPPMRRRESSSA